MLLHGAHPFPPDLEAMLREVLRVQPDFPDGKRPYAEQGEWMRRFDDWAHGRQLDEGRAVLRGVLAELTADAGGGTGPGPSSG